MVSRNRTPTDTENERLVRQLLGGIWTDRDVGVVNELVAEDVTVITAAFGVELHGVDQLSETMRRALDTFTDIEYTIQRLVVEDDVVVVQWTFEGTHEGSFMGIDPTNKRVDWTTVSFYTCEDGEITDYWGCQMPSASCVRKIASRERPLGSGGGWMRIRMW